MSAKNFWQVLAMLAVIGCAVALYCYARVDMGMSQEAVNQQLEHWAGQLSSLTILIWSQLIVAGICGLAYKAWKYREEQKRKDAA